MAETGVLDERRGAHTASQRPIRISCELLLPACGLHQLTANSANHTAQTGPEVVVVTIRYTARIVTDEREALWNTALLTDASGGSSQASAVVLAHPLHVYLPLVVKWDWTEVVSDG